MTAPGSDSGHRIGPGYPSLAGRVTQFGESEGFGCIVDDDGRQWFFHCTQIADGSRRIEIGEAVTFVVVPGHGGRYEASAVAKVPG